MIDQQRVTLDYLKHHLRNGAQKIEACMKEMETILHGMQDAVKTYVADVENSEDDPPCTDTQDPAKRSRHGRDPDGSGI